MGHLPEPGTVIDGFSIGERIHAGGMSVLFRVHPTGARPAIPFPLLMKVPRLGHGEPAANLITFEMEQTILGVLTGPHVPRVVAVGDLERQPYLVMEEIEGLSLKERVGAPRAPAEVARVGAAIATALHALHVQETIHLDVKPSNILLRPGGDAVLIDFGLAHHAHYPDLLGEELHHPIGSAPYISPEQVMGIRSDLRSDIYALGAVLYELATGRLPFGSPSSPAALRKRLYRDPPPPRVVVPDLAPWLQEVILRCLEPDPRRRYPSAAQLAFDLAHPEQIAVTDRGRTTRRAGARTVLRRWFRAVGDQPPPAPAPSRHLAGAAIVVAAVSPTEAAGAAADAMRDMVRRTLEHGHARLACVTVVPPTPELGGTTEGESATGKRIKYLALLRSWAAPLRLPPERLSLHVLEAADPARALLQYARTNRVDHIVIGAPPATVPAGAIAGTVSMRVVAEAPCTATMVRSTDPRAPGAAPPWHEPLSL